MTAQNPLAINGNLSREQGVLESTRMILDGFYLGEVLGAVQSRVAGWATSFGVAQRIGLRMDYTFVNPLY